MSIILHIGIYIGFVMDLTYKTFYNSNKLVYIQNTCNYIYQLAFNMFEGKYEQ